MTRPLASTLLLAALAGPSKIKGHDEDEGWHKPLSLVWTTGLHLNTVLRVLKKLEGEGRAQSKPEPPSTSFPGFQRGKAYRLAPESDELKGR